MGVATLEMENLIKVRTVTRRRFTKNINTLDSSLKEYASDPSRREEAMAGQKAVKLIYESLTSLDEKITKCIIEQDQWDEKDLEKEMEDVEKYKARWIFLETKCESLLKPISSCKSNDNKFKLPKLEIKKFDGNIKNWLSFWGHFKKIDSDISSDNVEKLQYLIQSMEPHTEVKNFVESFPLTEQSYSVCIAELKTRYAKEEMLIQLYVRELLSLILNRESKMDITVLYDNINSQLRALEVLKVTKEKYSAFLLPMVESALPAEILKAWERARPIETKDELECLMKFIQKEVESDQRIQMANSFNPKSSSEPAATALTVSTTNLKNAIIRCIWCDKAHSSTECYKLSKMSIEERREHLKNRKACALCLKPGHFTRVCKSYIKCYVCGQRHSPVFCTGITHTNKKKTWVDSKEKKPEVTQNYSSSTPGNSTTLLQTVAVKIQHGTKSEVVRALFDSGAQRSYLKEEVAVKLGMPPSGTEELSHSLFGGNSVSLQKYNCYNVTIENMEKSFKFSMNVLGNTNICKNVPKVNKDKSLSDLLMKNNIKLSDNEIHSSDIGLLIGADYSGPLLTNNIIQLKNGLTAIKTNLGWTLQGKTNNVTINNSSVTSLFCSQNVPNFWNLEILGIQDPVQVQSKQQKEEEVMLNFEENIQRNNENRYEVQLPWKPGHDDILSNREVAFRRLQAATNKLISAGKFQEYNNILNEWERAGIIESVSMPIPGNKNNIHYLPHRAVIKESSLTTKTRPVFDASTKDKNGKSLNACLEKGINFLDKIPDLLIGFRKGRIGITADIAKAFLQIAIKSEDKDYLRFLWWTDETRQVIKEYRHCRVVFGVTSSPFLLSATILHHLKNVKGTHRDTAELLSSSFYVDNLVTSLDSIETTNNFMKEAKNIMQQAKFDLRQWVTSLNINETKETIISVLGLLWDTVSDELFCNLNSLLNASELNKITKRVLLSLTQRIFDPIGILCPVTLIPRLLLQEVWNRDISWDEELPKDIVSKFYDWYDNIHYLHNCRLPRRLSSELLQSCTTSLHMLCDASKYGYAACIFLRTEDESGSVTIRLLSAKSRIAPPEKITIPRLELLAALIGSRLMTAIRKRLKINIGKEYCWTDSGVALCWIKKELEWNTFIGNRVREIRQNTNKNDWRHIPGTENWADIASRGCNPHQLVEIRWWEGPPWLYRQPEQWPKSAVIMDELEAKKELKKSAHVNTCCNKNEDNELYNYCYFSKYTKIIRMVTWMLRLIHNMRYKNNKIKGELTFEEYEEAEKKIIRLIQEESKETLEKQTRKLQIFYDNDKILRIKTKLLLTNFPVDVKTPIVLSAKNVIIQRMVEQRHVQLLHAGTNIMITDLRKRFWIIGVRKLVKSVIDKCIICKRHRSKPTQVTTAPLPLERVQASAPFEVTGVDLAGPIYLRNGEKCWIVLYTCAVYRAVHLELTQSLSTDAFLKTFRRFIARRGRVHVMISDNGTNFTGTKNLLSNIDWDEVQRQSTILRIKWKQNAPTAAWWGGFFERMVQIIKALLRRVLGMSSVSYEELQTLLCDCEAVVNDRPLTYVEGDDSNSLEPLKPSHFLQALPQSQVTDLDIIDSTNMNRRLRYLQKLREDFRQRFENEYLTELVQKSKDMKTNIKVGDIVLVESEEKRLKWPLGLIVEIYTGKDGIDRTAKIKTSAGFKIRPFQRLYQLELSSSEVEGEQKSMKGNKKDITGKKFNIIINPSSTVKEKMEPKESSTGRTDMQLTRSGREIKMPSRYKI